MGTMGDDSATVPENIYNELSSAIGWRYLVKRRTLDERDNALLVLLCGLLANQIYLILENNDVLEFHDFYGRQVL